MKSGLAFTPTATFEGHSVADLFVGVNKMVGTIAVPADPTRQQQAPRTIGESELSGLDIGRETGHLRLTFAPWQYARSPIPSASRSCGAFSIPQAGSFPSALLLEEIHE